MAKFKVILDELQATPDPDPVSTRHGSFDGGLWQAFLHYDRNARERFFVVPTSGPFQGVEYSRETPIYTGRGTSSTGKDKDRPKNGLVDGVSCYEW